MNIVKVNMTGYAPILKTDFEVSFFQIHIEYPLTGKCENVPLATMLHVFTERQILDGFNGKLSDSVWYSLATNSGHEVGNWMRALKHLLKI